MLVLDKEDACVLEVVQGKANAFIYDQISTYENWRRNPDATRALLKPFQEESWAVGLRKGDDDLRVKVNQFLKDFKAKGGFDELGDRYLKEQKRGFQKAGDSLLLLTVSWSRYFVASNDPGAPPPPRWVRALNFFIAGLVLCLVFYFSFHRLSYQLRWNSIYQYRQMFLQGWLTTVAISLAALGMSVCIGLFFALAQRSRLLPLRYFSKIYIEAVRGTPLLVQILIFFYVVADAFRVSNRYLVGVLTLSFFSGAYIAEIIRAGIESVSKSQLESAKAIGLTRAQTYRYVIFPGATAIAAAVGRSVCFADQGFFAPLDHWHHGIYLERPGH